MHSLFLSVQRYFIFRGFVSCRGSLVPGFPVRPKPALRIASNAVGSLSLSHPTLVLTHPSFPTVGNPSSHLFPTRNCLPPKRTNSNCVRVAGSSGRRGSPSGPGALPEQGSVTAGSAPHSGGTPSRRGAFFPPSHSRAALCLCSCR